MNKKSIFAIAVAVLVCLPCVLIMDGGSKAPQGEESIGWTNIIGTAWLAFLVLGGFQLITPKWMRDELSAYLGDED